MTYAERQQLYKVIERQRKSRVLVFVTSDRQHLETQIAPDCIPPFVEFLDEMGPKNRITLLLHTNGGQTSAAWRLVNLLKMFCDELEVLIPSKALSAGTLIALGADKIVMTKQAALGPIDPSLVHPLSPMVQIQPNMMGKVPVSVEAVRGYLDQAIETLKITDSSVLGNILINLSQHIHPIILGEIFRSREQIRFLAKKLIGGKMEADKETKLIDFLCADSGSHDYTINRREADGLGLPVEKPTQALYESIRQVEQSFSGELKLSEPYAADLLLGQEQNMQYTHVRGLIESRTGGSYRFLSEGTVSRHNAMPGVMPMQEAVVDKRTFEGWRKQ